MKKIIVSAVTLVTLLTIPHLQSTMCFDCECKATSKTFFTVRPQFQSASPEKDSLFHFDRMNVREDGYGGTFQIALFGGKSTESSKLSTYFTPFCKRCLLVKEDDMAGDADIRAQHFNIATINGVEGTGESFVSELSFCPKLSVFGIGLTFRQNISRLINQDEEKVYDIFFEISSPITRVETNMCLNEKIKSDGGGVAEIDDIDQQFFPNIKDAFKQECWKYGKIDCRCEMVKWGLADIELKIGIQNEKENFCYGGYIGAIAPTGNRPCAKYVFEPIVGNAKHWGLTQGGFTRYDLWKNEDGDKRIFWETYIHSQYLFERSEKRSLDLKHKPWSRYMEIYENSEQAQQAANLDGNAARLLSSPGINLLTRDVCVTPGLSVSFMSSVMFSCQNWSLELGYDLYARQAECVKLLCACEDESAIKAASGNGVTNKTRTINKDHNLCTGQINQFNSVNYQLGKIKREDLDLESASHPGLISYTVYGAASYRWDDREFPMLLGLGGSYEWGDENFVLSRWTIWTEYSFSW